LLLKVIALCPTWPAHFEFNISSAAEAKSLFSIALIVFLNNLVRIIDSGSKLFKWLRRRRALKMYWAVNTFGEAAFWDKK